MARWNLTMLQVELLKRSADRIAAGGKRITHDEIAKATGLPLPTVTAYIAGRVENPSIDKLTAIAEYLGVSVKDLIIEDNSAEETDAKRNRSQVAETPVVTVPTFS